MIIQLISIPDKFNSFSNIRYNCRKVLQHIRWLLSDGMIRQMIAEVDFIDNDDEKICNIELWKRDFYELSRDCIIPIHSILGRFIAGTMKIGKKIPKYIYQ